MPDVTGVSHIELTVRDADRSASWYEQVGAPMSFTDTSSRKKKTGNVTCSITGMQTDDEGNTFSLSGTVMGWIS